MQRRLAFGFLLAVSSKFCQEPFGIERFGSPDLLSQPLQLSALSRQIGRQLPCK
jgi:hypothetical protein